MTTALAHRFSSNSIRLKQFYGHNKQHTEDKRLERNISYCAQDDSLHSVIWKVRGYFLCDLENLGIFSLFLWKVRGYYLCSVM